MLVVIASLFHPQLLRFPLLSFFPHAMGLGWLVAPGNALRFVSPYAFNYNAPDTQTHRHTHTSVRLLYVFEAKMELVERAVLLLGNCQVSGRSPEAFRNISNSR